MLTVALDHERLYDIMTDHLEVRVANPVTDGSLRASEEVVEDSNLMAKNHETVDKM